MIAVLGATGTIGRHIVAGLAHENVEARAVVHRAAPPRELEPCSRTADLLDQASLRAVLEGATQLVIITPHGPEQERMERHALEAGLTVGVSRVVKLSGAASSLGPNGPTSTAVTHWHSERRIEASDVDFAFLRPSFLMQNLLGASAAAVARAGILVAPMGHGPVAMVDARDVAACAVAVLKRPESIHEAWRLTGPAGVSYHEVAAALGVPYVAVSPRLAERSLARRCVSSWEIDHTVRMAAHLASGAEGGVTDAVAALTGRPPRTLESFLEQHASRFAGPRPLAALSRRLSSTKGR